eukprot:52561_1
MSTQSSPKAIPKSSLTDHLKGGVDRASRRGSKRGSKRRSIGSEMLRKIHILPSKRHEIIEMDEKVEYTGPMALLKKPRKPINKHWMRVRIIVFNSIWIHRLQRDIRLYGSAQTPEQFARQRPNFNKPKADGTKPAVGAKVARATTTIRVHDRTGQETTQTTKWFVCTGHPWRQLWEHVVLALILYSLIILPLEIGLTDTIRWTAWSVIVDILFVSDIFVNYF